MLESLVLELALNLVWLGISVILLVIGVSHVARGGEYRSVAVAAVALLCLVCLLFPVISMTDDLNSGGPAMLEPGKLKRLVQSVPVVLTLLPWAALQAPPENCWAAIDQQPEIALPSQEGFSFRLNRRPPPPQLSIA